MVQGFSILIHSIKEPIYFYWYGWSCNKIHLIKWRKRYTIIIEFVDVPTVIATTTSTLFYHLFTYRFSWHLLMFSTSTLSTTTLHHEGRLTPASFPSSTRTSSFPTTTLHCKGNLVYSSFTSSTSTTTFLTKTFS
jgi:hypothetical protein